MTFAGGVNDEDKKAKHRESIRFVNIKVHAASGQNAYTHDKREQLVKDEIIEKSKDRM